MEFTLKEPTTARTLAKRYGLVDRGADRDIVTMGALSARTAHRERMVTYVTSERWARELDPMTGVCILPSALRGLAPESCTALLTDRDPADAFFEIFADSVDERRWETLEDSRGTGTMIADTATVYPGVQIGDDCQIMSGAVLLPGSRLGDRVTVKPNAVIGGEGFQVRAIRGRRRVVPHAGGVNIGDDCSIGSQTCIDRGLFGDATRLDREVMVDNLIHIAHSAVIGVGSSLIACCEISGSVTLGAGVWVGPNSAINPGITLGDHAYIGTGSTVVRDVPDHALAYGSPARQGGWVCTCHTKLVDGTCPACGSTYDLR